MEELGAFMEVNARFRYMVGGGCERQVVGNDGLPLHRRAGAPRSDDGGRSGAGKSPAFIYCLVGLVAINTFMNTVENSELVTRTNWNGTGASQIDYVLADEAILVLDVKWATQNGFQRTIGQSYAAGKWRRTT